MLSLFRKISLWSLGATGGRALERDGVLYFMQEEELRGRGERGKERNQQKKVEERRHREEDVKRREREIEVIGRKGEWGSGW